MTAKGLTISGTSPNDEVVEAVEVSTNKFHVGVQFHPEYKSTVANPHPLFVSFVKAMIENKDKRNKK